MKKIIFLAISLLMSVGVFANELSIVKCTTEPDRVKNINRAIFLVQQNNEVIFANYSSNNKMNHEADVILESSNFSKGNLALNFLIDGQTVKIAAKASRFANDIYKGVMTWGQEKMVTNCIRLDEFGATKNSEI